LFKSVCILKSAIDSPDAREENNFIQVYHIGRRRDIYDQFKRLLIELQKS
jgi:hypothetical protein